MSVYAQISPKRAEAREHNGTVWVSIKGLDDYSSVSMFFDRKRDAEIIADAINNAAKPNEVTDEEVEELLSEIHGAASAEAL